MVLKLQHKGSSYTICTPEGLEAGTKRTGKIVDLFVYNNFDKCAPVALCPFDAVGL